MNCRSRFLRLAAISAATLLPAAAAVAADWNVNVSTPPRGAESRSQVRVDFDGVPPFAAEERLMIPRLDVPVLKIRLPASSGLSVRAGTGPDYSVRVCKAAASPRDLAQLSVTAHGGELAFHWPETGRGLVFLIVSAPPDAALDLEASNGPVALKVPEGYASGASIETAGHSPVHCASRACRDSRRTSSDGRRRIELGEPEPVIRLSTVNGPVSVETGGEED